MALVIKININANNILTLFAENISEKYGFGEQLYNCGYIQNKTKIYLNKLLKHKFEDGAEILSIKLIKHYNKYKPKHL